MKHDARRVIEVLIDELGQVLRLAPEAVSRLRARLEEWLRPRWAVLFLATGERAPDEAAVEAFRALVALGVEASLVRSRSFREVEQAGNLSAFGPVAGGQPVALHLIDNPSSDAIGRMAEEFPLLCVLALSENTVTKTILGLRDSKPPVLLRAFLERGKPVVAVGRPPQRVELDGGGAAYWSLPRPMRQWVADGYRILEQWGVEFVEPEGLLRAVRKHLFGLPDASVLRIAKRAASDSGRRIVTVEDVREARNRGDRRIALAANAIVTDEAREFARRWGIAIT
jgi:hypothetical protein